MTSVPNYTDEFYLIRQLRIGDEKAYEYVFETYYGYLCHYSRKLVQNHALSEDIVHDIFCNLWVKKKEIKINSSLKSYLFKAVYHASISQLRNNQRELKYAQEKYLQFIESEMILSPDREVEMINHELRNKIYQSIDSLPEKCQKVFRLSRFSGLKNQEIADELGISLNTVQTQMKIALRKLRSMLGNQRFLLLMMMIDSGKIAKASC